MSFVPISDAQDNMHLLAELMSKHGTFTLGVVSNFFAVGPHWRCPCCLRSKPEIVRVDRNGHLLCSIVMHHDHFSDVVADKIKTVGLRDYGITDALHLSLTRFPETLICGDCNVVEPAAKRAVGAQGAFSFAPHEIASFIKATPNAPHDFDVDAARTAYEVALPAMSALADRLRAVMRAQANGGDTWEPIAHCASRALFDIHRKMKDAAE